MSTDLLERLKSALENRYALESEIGRGGMAVVFLAEDRKHGRNWMPVEGGNPTRVLAYDDLTLNVDDSSLSVGPDHLYFTVDESESDIRVVDLAW